jgi:hypothetical protein
MLLLPLSFLLLLLLPLLNLFVQQLQFVLAGKPGKSFLQAANRGVWISVAGSVSEAGWVDLT